MGRIANGYVFAGSRGGAAPFTPLALFASDEEGAWYDPSDLSTMFQNSDGTTAVAAGDPVGYIADKSGNANHATQATAAARPTLRQTAGGLYYLEFDGVDDHFKVPSITLKSSDTMAVHALEPSRHDMFIGWRPGTSQERFYLQTDAIRKGDGSLAKSTYTLDEKVIVSHVFDPTGADFRLNGENKARSVDSWDEEFVIKNYVAASAQLNPDDISFYFQGKYFGGVIVKKVAGLSATENWLATNAGVTLA